MSELSLQNIISRYEIYSLDKHLPENEFDKKIRDKQGYVLFDDGDVTSYIKLLKQCGIVLYGEEIQEVFADVSDEDFWSAISADIENYDFHDYDARYFASNILILGRILSFKKEKRILSKYEGGIWMI